MSTSFPAPPVRRWRALTAVDVLHLTVLALLVVVSPLAVYRGGAGWWLPVGYAAMGAAIWAFACAEAARPERRTVRDLHFWYPVLAVPLVFWSLYWIVPGVNPGGLNDAALLDWDRRLLRVDLVACMRTIEAPVLTDVMHLFYLVYFAMPVALILWLRARATNEALSEAVFVLCLAFFLCYVGYVAVPATGPRTAVYGTNEMSGWVITQPLRDAFDSLEPCKTDAFPSAHAAVTLVVAGLAVRHDRSVAPWLAVLVAGILFSLVYARYHYAVDVIAGAAWAAVAMFGGTYLYAAWGRVRTGPESSRSADAPYSVS